jgi:hypothetical protein
LGFGVKVRSKLQALLDIKLGIQGIWFRVSGLRFKVQGKGLGFGV